MANPERKVPVFKTENSIIDQEFSSIRERFDNEMRRMEQEMDRFRNEISGGCFLQAICANRIWLNLIETWISNIPLSTVRPTDRERDFFGKSISDFNTSSRSTSNYVTSSTTKNESSNLVQRQTSNQLNSWLDDINSPLVQDTNDGKALKLRFDVTQYLPEEIVVKTVDNRLQVSARPSKVSWIVHLSLSLIVLKNASI